VSSTAETLDAARAWVDAWQRGWAHHDPEVIATRYAAGCRFQSQPFRPMGSGPEAVATYARASFAEEREARFVFGDPIAGEGGRAAVEYRAVVIDPGGEPSTLHGVSVLRFDGDGLVAEHRDCWTMIDGDRGLEPLQEATS